MQIAGASETKEGHNQTQEGKYELQEVSYAEERIYFRQTLCLRYTDTLWSLAAVGPALDPVLMHAADCSVGVYESSEDSSLKQDFILAGIFLQVVNK